MFVENRVNEICSLVPVECWFHTPGRDNPADIPLWGAKASQLQTSDTWFHGPSCWFAMKVNGQLLNLFANLRTNAIKN